jgi:ribonuclease HI
VTIHIYTDGGIRPDKALAAGTGHGGTGYTAVDAEDGSFLFEGASHYPGPTTNQRMELLAAIEGIEAARTYAGKDRTRQIVVHSDSAYMVNCLKQEWWFNWMVKQGGQWLNSSKKPVENADLWRRLLALCQLSYYRLSPIFGPREPWKRLQNPDDRVVIKASIETGLNVSFVKVKGHSGIPLNERADQLATKGKNGQTVQYPDAGG